VARGVFDDGRAKVAIVGSTRWASAATPFKRCAGRSRRRPGSPPVDLIGAVAFALVGPHGLDLAGRVRPCLALVRRLAYEQSTIGDPKYLARVEQA